MLKSIDDQDKQNAAAANAALKDLNIPDAPTNEIKKEEEEKK